MQSWRLVLPALLVPSIVTVVLPACTQKVWSDKSTLYVGISTAPVTLDPRRATDAFSARILGLIYEPLVTMDADLQFVGVLAESWKKTKSEYVFHLKKGLTFSDGSPISRSDILFSINEFQKPTFPFATVFKVIQSVEVEGPEDQPQQVRISLNQVSATFLTDLAVIGIMKKAHVEALGADFSRHPLGSGPYVLESLGVNDVSLRLRPDYRDPSPWMPRIVFKIVRDDTTRYLKLRKGEIDLVQSDLPVTKAIEFRSLPGFRTVERSALAMSYMLVNHQDVDLKKPNIRRAIAWAIQRDDVIRFKMEGLGEAATSILSPENPFFNARLQWPKNGLEEARKLLALDPPKSKEWTLKVSNKSTAVEKAQVLAAQIQKLGIEVRVQTLEWGTYYEDIKKGNFQLATMAWVGVTDPDIYRVSLHSREFPPGRNRGRYSSPEMDRLTDEGFATEDFAARKRIYDRVQEVAFQDLATIPLWHDKQVAILHAGIENYRLPVAGDYNELKWVRKK